MEEILTDVAGTLSIHEHGGQFGVYEEWKPGDLTRHEFPTREEAEAYIEEVRRIDPACNQYLAGHELADALAGGELESPK